MFGNGELLQNILEKVQSNATALAEIVSKYAGEEKSAVGGNPKPLSTPKPAKKRKRRNAHVSTVKR